MSKIAPTPSVADLGVHDHTQAASLVTCGALTEPDVSVQNASLLALLRPIFDAAFTPFRQIVLAVSGGADSCALLHLAATWRAERKQAAHHSLPTFSVVTVDHALRPGSALEAQTVASAAAALGLEHTTLVWDEPKPRHGVQAAARAARYRLIGRHLDAIGASAVVTAHTVDDQAETLLMRLARGSGIDGLASMRFKTPLAERHVLLRPLLGARKATLISYLTEHGVAWSEDPSNASEGFERVRLRNAMANLKRSGFELDAVALARTAARSARASDALATITARTWEEGGAQARFDPLGFAVVNWKWLLAQPEEIRVRLLSGLVNTVGGQATAVSLGQLEALTVHRGWQIPSGITLHGTQWDTDQSSHVRIYRERGRTALQEVLLQPNGVAQWDGRFTIRSTAACPMPVLIGPLGISGLAELATAGCRRPDAPARILWTLPALRLSDGLAAVPTLGFVRPELAGMLQCEPILPHFTL